jgi:hypothetical protein
MIKNIENFIENEIDYDKDDIKIKNSKIVICISQLNILSKCYVLGKSKIELCLDLQSKLLKKAIKILQIKIDEF